MTATATITFCEPLAHRLEAYIVGVGVLGALATVLWLLVKGVNEARWNEPADKEGVR